MSGTAAAISAANSEHLCAIQAGTGIVVCWGRSDDGQTTPPDAVNGVSGTATVIGVGFFHSCAIQATTGNAVCWGKDLENQSTPPDAVNGTTGTASAIEGGLAHTCAIQAESGDVICWGHPGGNGQVTVPPDSVNGVSGTASALAVGNTHSCAIQVGTNAVACWGNGPQGQLAPSPETASVISAGLYHSLAFLDHGPSVPSLGALGLVLLAFALGMTVVWRHWIAD